MFSDRFWLLKAAAALGIFAALCTRSRTEFSRKAAELDQAAMPPDRVRGMPVYFWARKVLSLQPDGFEVQSRVGPCRVLATPPFPAPGEHVSAAGTIVGYRLIRADRVQVNEGYRWKRPLNYAVSVATVLVFLGLIRKRFRGRLREGFFAGRY
jgi:hypothetical protein